MRWNKHISIEMLKFCDPCALECDQNDEHCYFKECLSVKKFYDRSGSVG